jgi:D-alanine-D-alanine ligase
MGKKRTKHIAIVAGGYSSEHSISIESANEVLKSLNPDKYEATIVTIDKNNWQALTDSGALKIDKNDFSFGLNGSTRRFDGVFNAIHGTPGENGILQAYFDLISLPYTGCDFFCSSLTFNKFSCNNMLRSMGIPVAKSILIRKGDSIDTKKIISEVNLPCFVKPNNGGSSCGTHRANHEEDLIPAIEDAFKEDPEVIIEAFLKGRELTCGLVKTRSESLVFPLTEIVSKKEFFDYEAKYTPGVADEITPARVEELVTKQCEDLSQKIYSILGCKGLVRMDYILVDQQLYFLEVNTVPGMSTKSIVPQQIRAFGMTTSEVYSLILDDILTD